MIAEYIQRWKDDPLRELGLFVLVNVVYAALVFGTALCN